MLDTPGQAFSASYNFKKMNPAGEGGALPHLSEQSLASGVEGRSGVGACRADRRVHGACRLLFHCRTTGWGGASASLSFSFLEGSTTEKAPLAMRWSQEEGERRIMAGFSSFHEITTSSSQVSTCTLS